MEYLVGALIVFAILAGIASLARPKDASPVRSEAWSTHITVDPMTDIATTLIARKSDDVDSAMVLPEHAMLSISLEQRKVISAMVRLSQIDINSMLECRIDDQEAQPVNYVRVGSSLVINSGVQFIDALRAARHLRVRLSSSGRFCLFTFDLTGLDDAIKRVTSGQ